MDPNLVGASGLDLDRDLAGERTKALCTTEPAERRLTIGCDHNPTLACVLDIA